MIEFTFNVNKTLNKGESNARRKSSQRTHMFIPIFPNEPN